MVNIFGYISESKYMVPSTGKNKTRLRLDQLGLSLLRGLHVCFVSFEGLTHAKQGKVADWKHQTPIQPKHEATSRSSCRRCLSSASSACSTCPHLQSQAITDQWWIAPLGHRICLKNPKTMHSLAPKNWFQNDIEIQIRHVSPPSMHSQLLHLFTWSRQSYCYHQFKVRMYGIKLSSPRTFHPCFNVATSSTAAWEDTRCLPHTRAPSWNLWTLIPLQGFQCMRRYAILLLGHSSSFKSPLPISMRKHCLHCSGHHT